MGREYAHAALRVIFVRLVLFFVGLAALVAAGYLVLTYGFYG
jgi:hypothetical protein